MDIQQYISSGIIEAYVLGIASGEEVRELELLSTQHPEIAAAVKDYQQSLEDFSALHAITPPPGLKEQIWSVLEKENIPDAPVHPPLEHTGNLIDFSSNEGKGGKKVMLYRSLAASVALLLTSLVFNFIFWNKSRTTDQELAQVKAAQEQLNASNQQFKEQLALSERHMQLLTDPAVKSIPLAGVGTHTDNNAMLLWDSHSKEVYLSLKNMPPPPSGKQYQLWAIVDGKPVDLGVYALNPKDTLQKMKNTPAAQMFAITLEKAGGSPSPTLDQMFVAGKV